MKVFVDNDKTLGSKLILTNITEWTDFNDRTKILGTVFTVVLPERSFEKIFVKVRKNIDFFNDLEINTLVCFENLNGSVYNIKGKQRISFKATDVIGLENES